jgi:hypothetical protein
MDGKVQAFEFPLQTESTKAGARLQELLNMDQLVIELADRLVVIPKNNVRFFELVPAPSRLPQFVIHNAKPVHKTTKT